jgi:nucleoside-diphosphate-sugar epimerase
MMKIAVLGATGPTGIHLVTELRKTVATVRVVARSMDKLARLFPEAAVEKWEADIVDANATLLAIDGCDLVYDCIGLPGDQMHLHPVTARNIANALRHTKARCVQVSSYWAYYPQVRAEMNENHPRNDKSRVRLTLSPCPGHSPLPPSRRFPPPSSIKYWSGLRFRRRRR